MFKLWTVTGIVETVTPTVAVFPFASVIVMVVVPAETGMTVKAALGPEPWAGVSVTMPVLPLLAFRCPE
jgi:hypothetical protein